VIPFSRRTLISSSENPNSFKISAVGVSAGTQTSLINKVISIPIGGFMIRGMNENIFSEREGKGKIKFDLFVIHGT